MAGIYLYAIIPTNEQGFFDVSGLAALDAHGAAYTIPHNGIAAVVSPSPLVDYRGLQRMEAAAYLVAHQRVVEQVMEDYPMLPVKFGTVLPDEDTVRHLLAQGESLFRSNLEKNTGLVQMEVVVLWNLAKVFEEISQEEPVAQLKAQIGSRPPEETKAERIAVGRIVHTLLEKRRTALQDRVLPPLREVALDMVVNPSMDDSMVANVALLVESAVQADGREALDQQLQLLDRELGGRYTFRQVGPLPPYSFATVEVHAPSFEEVDRARRYLELGETAASGEIKAAYRRLAGRFHPDFNPNDPEAEARMAELTQAYRFLTTYADSQAMGADADGTGSTEVAEICCFDRQAVEQTLLIAIRRQEMAV